MNLPFDPTSQRSLLLTGSKGFVGQKLVGHLRGAGYKVADLYPHSTDSRIDLGDRQQLTNYLSQVRPEIIVHLAGRYPARHSAQECYLTHVIGTANLLEAAAAVGTTRRFLSVGSAAEYGLRPDATPISVEAACRPVSDYGCSKLHQSEMVRVLGTRFGINWVVLRAFNLFGTHQPPGLVIPDTIHRMRSAPDAKTLPIHSAESVRDFLPVEVFCEILTQCIGKTGVNGIYNACSGQGVSIGTLSKWIAEELSFGGELEFESSALGQESSCSVGDPTPLLQSLERTLDLDIEQEIRRVAREW